MQLNAILAVMAGLLGATEVLAYNCYHVGAEFQDLNSVFFHIGRACSGYDSNRGALQGYFNPGEEKYACVNVENNHHIILAVTNRNSHQGFDLDDKDCGNELASLADICSPNGGEVEIAGWFFR